MSGQPVRSGADRNPLHPPRVAESLVFYHRATPRTHSTFRRIGKDQPNGPLSLSTIASKERSGRLPIAGPPGPKEKRWQRRPPYAERKLVFL
jgi:hypothetical protein